MREATPFYYFKYFSAEEAEYILNHLTQPNVYTTALAEYRLARKEDATTELKSKKGGNAMAEHYERVSII